MLNCYSEAPYTYNGNIDTFHEWLLFHPKLLECSEKAMNIIFHALRKGEEVHELDRRLSGEKYSAHLIRTVIALLEKYNTISPRDIIVLILHDSLEDHTECWKSIYESFGIIVFRDILALSTAGIDFQYRKEMIEFFNSMYPTWRNFPKMRVIPGDFPILDIMRILSPADPIFKSDNESGYSDNYGVEALNNIKRAIKLYHRQLQNKYSSDELDTNGKYIGLGNYLYFTEDDARRKLQDMLDNMDTIALMEKAKSGYIQTRRIKAYILGVKLKNLGMWDEYNELEATLTQQGVKMISENELI